MNQDEEVMEFYPKLMTQAETRGFVAKIKKMFEEYGYGLYAIDHLESQTFIGYIGFWYINFESPYTPFLEIGWKIKKAFWNKGLATEGATACLKFGFTQLHLKTIHSFTAKINYKSERIMQKIGMKKIAEFEHPKIESGSSLKMHVLYKIEH
jgi:ribosomal-protein-alanine N-acetyltransferase